MTRAITRRSLLAASAAVSLAASGRQSISQSASQGSAEPEGFSRQAVRLLAERLAGARFEKPRSPEEAALKQLKYDQYRDIRFRPDRSLWRGESLGHEVQFFPLGWLYDVPVEIHIVENGTAVPFNASKDVFDIGALAGPAAEAAARGLSGFRLHCPINRPDYADEYVVFQGASYFRAVGRNQAYGLSARALAIDTAEPSGEEFPFFRAFWIEKPARNAEAIVVHGLLDSPSCAGAYTFSITAGAPTTMLVEAAIYPRREIAKAGVAPLTSMFLTGSAGRRITSDFRPAVHDSEGLAITTGAGEQIWRPLTNPKILQVSAFSDRDLKGFGLMQRDRRFTTFEDLEARYEKRPSCWVEPQGEWGEGSVVLIEIPTDEEIHDNVAVFWRPSASLSSGRGREFSYKLHWTDRRAGTTPILRVAQTRVGTGRKGGSVLFVIDFDGKGLEPPKAAPIAAVSASAGEIRDLVVQPNSETRGYRASFSFVHGSAPLCELRLVLESDKRVISETWLYRWTPA